MLIKDAEQIGAKIAELERKREIAKSIKGFQVRAEMLERPLMILRPLAMVLTEFQKRGVVIDLEDCSPTSRMLKGFTIQIQAHFEASPESILESDEQLRRQFWELLEIKEFPNSVKVMLLKAWQKYIDALIAPQKTNLLDTLVLVPALSSDINKMRQLYIEVSGRRQKLPQSEFDFMRLQTIQNELANLWRRFGGDLIPEEVLKFLRAASSPNGARFNQLTPTVQQWLQEHDLEKSIRLLF